MGKKLRVVMLGPYPLDSSRIWGGVEAAYLCLVNGLSQIGDLEIHVLTIRQPNTAGPDHVKHGTLSIHLIPSYPRFERLRNFRTYQSTINKTLSQIQPDLIHAQDASSDALVAMRSGFPTAVTVHGIRWEDGKHYSKLNMRLRVLYDCLVTERYVMSHLRHLISCSHYVTSYFKDIMRPDIDIHYVTNAVDERFFNLANCPDEQVILFAGRVIPRKRVMDLVQAFALVLNQIPSARFHIAGETSSEPKYVESIRKWMHQSHIDEQVRLLGPLSQDAILQEYAGCTLLALPSAQETVPSAIAQAMAARKPVVATRVGGVVEMIGGDSAGGFLVNVGNIDGLAAAMVRLLQNPDLQAKMGQKGREIAQENHHPESVARRNYEVYRSIALKEQKILV